MMCSIVKCTVIICVSLCIHVVHSKNSKLLFSEQEIGKCYHSACVWHFLALFKFVRCTFTMTIARSSDTARATVYNQLFMALLLLVQTNNQP